MEKNTLKQLMKKDEKVIIEYPNFFYNLTPVKVELKQTEKERILKEFPAPKLPQSVEVKSIFDIEPKTYVKDIPVLVDAVEEKITTTKKPFLQFQFTNNKGMFRGKMWNDGHLEDTLEFLEKNKVCMLEGTVDEFPEGSGNKSITVRDFNKIEKGSISPLALLPATVYSFEDLIVELFYYVKQLKEPHKSVVMALLKDNWEQFRLKPAAKEHHHNYLGGLLQHTVEMMRMGWYVIKICKKPVAACFKIVKSLQDAHQLQLVNQIVEEERLNYRKLTWNEAFNDLIGAIGEFAKGYHEEKFDADLFLASIVMHDIGKIFDYTHTGDQNKMKTLFSYAKDVEEYEEIYETIQSGIVMDEVGALLGHMASGILLLQKTLQKHQLDVDVKTIAEYMHVILAHHGKLEYGSPVKPATPNAWLVHIVDNFSAKYEKEEMEKRRG